jgi:pyrroline-5-carboxylate reductase
MVLEDERCPGALKDAVCSPAGTTIEGVAALEKDGFRNAVFDAVKAAHDKSASMGKK